MLVARFGAGSVFKDVDDIDPGDDFVERITDAVADPPGEAEPGLRIGRGAHLRRIGRGGGPGDQRHEIGRASCRERVS